MVEHPTTNPLPNLSGIHPQFTHVCPVCEAALESFVQGRQIKYACNAFFTYDEPTNKWAWNPPQGTTSNVATVPPPAVETATLNATPGGTVNLPVVIPGAANPAPRDWVLNAAMEPAHLEQAIEATLHTHIPAMVKSLSGMLQTGKVPDKQ